MVVIFPIFFILLFWFLTFNQGITTAIEVWSISEIFTHCFLVIPGAFYLIYQKRNKLAQQSIAPNLWLLIPLLGLLVIYTFGVVGDIRLLMHIASFASLPLLIWLMIGNKAASVILFPLYFILYSVPFGEALIPFLQELTTDIAVPLLEITGVPIYRNGLYLDIPEGRFLVAEACSGISFLIASVVFGNVYAFLSFQRFNKQISFVGISIVVPIIANAIRVYGIVLTGHLSNMEYAVGADHLIYGGVFYGIIIFLLIVIGERFRDKNVDFTSSVNASSEVDIKNNSLLRVLGCVSILFVAQFYWLSLIESNRMTSIENDKRMELSELPFVTNDKVLSLWQPNFIDATNLQQGYLQDKVTKQDSNIEFFIATYANGKGELISSLNRLYNADRWVLLNHNVIHVDGGSNITLTKLTSPVGKIRYIAHWYQLGDMVFTSKVKVKLFQTLNLLLGNQKVGRLVAFSTETSIDIEKTKRDLLKFIEKYNSTMNKT
jgi:exosortase A